MASFFTLGALITASFIFIPHDSHFLILLITLVLLLGALTFGMRGIMYAQVNEIRIPKEFTGTAMGILICIGFSPKLMSTLSSDTFLIRIKNLHIH